MATSRPIYDGSQYGCGYEEWDLMQDASDHKGHTSETFCRLSTRIPFPVHAVQSRRQHVSFVKSNDAQLCDVKRKGRMSYTTLLDLGFTDRDLLPSQHQRVQDLISISFPANDEETAPGRKTAQVQPCSNPYHWEAPADRKSTSPSVKALCDHPDEMIQQRAGTLKRNTAVRRSRKECTSLLVGSTVDVTAAKPAAFRHDRLLSEHNMRPSFSFEDEELHANLNVTWEQAEQEVVSKATSVTRIDSGIGKITEGRRSRFREELDQRPRIARTFSEILGSEPFVPTALLDCD
ncbi:hypothetical protein M3J09_005768 [Ascochyta lentis]